MITNFPPKSQVNTGGYKNFSFLTIENLLSYPVIINGSCQTAITTKNGALWLLGYATPESLIFSEDHKDTENGNIYLQKVSGFVPGNKPELVELMQVMDGRRFIILLRDFHGIPRLIGYPANPLRFTSQFQGENSRTGKKGFTFSFESESLTRAPAYPF